MYRGLLTRFYKIWWVLGISPWASFGVWSINSWENTKEGWGGGGFLSSLKCKEDKRDHSTRMQNMFSTNKDTSSSSLANLKINVALSPAQVKQIMLFQFECVHTILFLPHQILMVQLWLLKIMTGTLQVLY